MMQRCPLLVAQLAKIRLVRVRFQVQTLEMDRKSWRFVTTHDD